MTKLFSILAVLALAACSGGDDGATSNVASAQSDANKTSPAIEGAMVVSAASPLPKEQALKLMHERHENYEKIGKAMRAAKKGIAANDLPAVRSAAAQINALAPRAAGWFPAGTGPDVGKTDAKAEIWQQPAQFADAMKQFRVAAAGFNQAAAGTNLPAIEAAHANLGKTCKSCHDRVRKAD